MSEIRILDRASKFVEALSIHNKAKVAASMSMLRDGRFELVRIKKLRNKIKELIVKDCRFTFFIHDSKLYFVSGFIKKNNKTPKHEIDYTENIYKLITK